MRNKEILAIAMLGIMVVSTFAFVQPVVVAEDEGIFKITMIAPGSANLLRRQWGLIIANSFQSVGIDASMVFMGWGSVYDRCLTPAAENIGKLYDEGGWDALFIGWSPGSPSSPFAGTYQIYYSTNTPPNSNYMLWNNATSDTLIGTMITKGYNAEGIQAFKDWQKVQYQDLPASGIILEETTFTADNSINFHGMEWLFDNIGPCPQFITGSTDLILASTGELLGLNPPLVNGWYDTVAWFPMFDPLYFLNQSFQYEPAVAAALPTVSADGYEYTIPLKHGVKWHDGVEVTADDVLFSWLAYMNQNSGAQKSGSTSGYIGTDITFNWLNGTSTRLVCDFVSGVSYYPAAANETGTAVASITALDTYTVKIKIADFATFGKPAATFMPEGIVEVLVPKHILETVPFEDWLTHPFNTGQGSYTVNGVTYYGPIGCGPYKFANYSIVNALVTLEKFDDYWNATGLESKGMFGVQNYYVRYIVEKDSAIAALKNGEVHVLDAQYQLQRDYLAGNLNFATNYVLPGSGIQQLGYNLRSPIWGTGVDTPNGQTDPANAALYARYVRMAFDCLIPRQLILDNLLSGQGEIAAVHVNPLSPYRDTTIVPRAYDPVAAKNYLALAGYEVGVTPGGPTATTNYLINEPITFTGTFTVDPVAGIQQGGFVALLQHSTDNVTFTPVAQDMTTSGGYYELTYTPTVAGTHYFKVLMTGVGALTAAQTAAAGPDFPYSQITPSVTSQETPAVAVTVGTIDTAIASTTSQVASLNTQVSSLNAQVASLTNLIYVAIAIAIIAILIALYFAMRKK